MQVLFVDDNPLMQQVISRFLIGQGYTVTIAESAEQALRLIRQTAYNLIVVDMRLPDRDGPELLQALRQERDLLRCPVIAMSGLGEDDRERTLLAGFDGFLSKPVDLDELLAMVRRYVGGEQARMCGV